MYRFIAAVLSVAVYSGILIIFSVLFLDVDLKVLVDCYKHSKGYQTKVPAMPIKGGRKSPFFMNTIFSYYIPFWDNLGIIFPKFEVPSINDGSHRGK